MRRPGAMFATVAAVALAVGLGVVAAPAQAAPAADGVRVAESNGGIFFHTANAMNEGQQYQDIDTPPFSQDYRGRLWSHADSDHDGTSPNPAQEWLVRH